MRRLAPLLLLLALAVPLPSAAQQAAPLDGLWTLRDLSGRPTGADSPPEDTLQSFLFRVEAGEVFGRLACSWIGGRYGEDPARFDAGSFTIDGTKCPEADVADAARVAAVLGDPEAVYALGDTLLEVTSPAGGLRLDRVAGSRGPLDPALDVLGDWRIMEINGRPPLPGPQEDGRAPTVVFDLFRVSGYAGCNGGGADILWMEDGFRTISPMVSTAMHCGALTDQENEMFAILSEARLRRVGEGLLVSAPSGLLLLRRP